MIILEDQFRKLSGKRRGVWQTRTFVLESDKITYFKSKKKLDDHFNVILLSQVTAIRPAEPGKYGSDYVFEVVVPGRVYAIDALSANARLTWIIALDAAVTNLSKTAGIILKEGTLSKANPKGKGFSSRYFVLYPRKLFYFDSETAFNSQERPRGCIPIPDCSEKTIHLDDEDPNLVVIRTPYRKFLLRAKDSSMAQMWLSEIETAASFQPNTPEGFSTNYNGGGSYVSPSTPTPSSPHSGESS